MSSPALPDVARGQPKTRNPLSLISANTPLHRLSAESLHPRVSKLKPGKDFDATDVQRLNRHNQPARLSSSSDQLSSRPRPQRTSDPQPSSYSLLSPLTSQWPIQEPPLELQVYYMPDGRHVPDWSVIHQQKQQNGFFCHPMLVIGLNKNDQKYAHFYALTKAPPHAIGDLRMCLRIGDGPFDEGEEVLKLAHGSDPMQHETWINLEQLFVMEWKFLEYWAANVIIDRADVHKLRKKIDELESLQNRYIYKPLWRDLSNVVVGTVLMMPNDPKKSKTLGAPVLVLANHYPRVAFLRVKMFADNANFTASGIGKCNTHRRYCLRISRYHQGGHDGTPTMVLAHDSPEMREPSYVEVSKVPRWGKLDRFKTWCVPPVRISVLSMRTLWQYMENVFPAEGNPQVQAPPMHPAYPTRMLKNDGRRTAANGMYESSSAAIASHSQYGSHQNINQCQASGPTQQHYAAYGPHLSHSRGGTSYMQPTTPSPSFNAPNWGYPPPPLMTMPPTLGHHPYAMSRLSSASDCYTGESRPSSRSCSQ